MYPLIRQLLFKIDPEKSHHLSLNALSVLEKLHLSGLLAANVADNPTQVMGLTFKNTIRVGARAR